MFAAALVDFFAQATCSDKSLQLGIEEEPAHFSSMSRPTQKDEMEKKWRKDWKKDPARVRAKREMELINTLGLDVPRSLQAEAQERNPDPKEAFKQRLALRAFTTISTAHAGHAAGSASVAVDYPRGHPMRRSLINAEYEELSRRRIKMLMEDQGWHFVPHASKKDEEEARQLCSGAMLDIQAAGEEAHEQIQVTD
jgi:hypothetical protein